MLIYYLRSNVGVLPYDRGCAVFWLLAKAESGYAGSGARPRRRRQCRAARAANHAGRGYRGLVLSRFWRYSGRALFSRSLRLAAFRGRKMFNRRLIERRAPVSWRPAPRSKKEFSKTALTEEQTFGDRDRGGKTLPKSADRGFSALQLPGPWLWLVYRTSGISHAPRTRIKRAVGRALSLIPRPRLLNRGSMT
jgi:hypothetical protein